MFVLFVLGLRGGNQPPQSGGIHYLLIRYAYTNVPFIYRVSNVYLPYIYRVSNVIDSGEIV